MWIYVAEWLSCHSGDSWSLDIIADWVSDLSQTTDVCLPITQEPWFATASAGYDSECVFVVVWMGEREGDERGTVLQVTELLW